MKNHSIFIFINSCCIILFREPKMRGFTVGERILATWADGRKYPARVNAVLGNGECDMNLALYL